MCGYQLLGGLLKILRGRGGSLKSQTFKGKYEPKLESRRDFFFGRGGGLNKKTCIGGVWIFRVTTHNTLNGPSFSFN